MTTTATEDIFEVVYALEGHAKPFAIEVPVDASDAMVFNLIANKHGLGSDHRLFWEDDTEESRDDDEHDALVDVVGLVSRLRVDFRQIHVGRSGKIAVSVRYNARTVERKFRPNATIRRVIRWAISKKGLDLIGQPAEFQIKHDGKVIPPQTHLGQLARCDDALAFVLVANIKPQGC